jgi:4-hydroxy-tetrahydrodipicolinate synthase
MPTRFKGAMVAIVTPFKNGKVDEKALRGLIEFQIENGTDVIVPCGTTGESATLSHTEHEKVLEVTIAAVGGRVPVVAGTGSNSTEEALKLTHHAHKSGADGVLMITPYYNKPTQEGLFQHFRKIAEEVDIPIILYNVPGRTSVNMAPETVARLAEFKNIVGIKEATASLQQVSETIHICPEEFAVISGDDFTTLPLLAVGGKGTISVTANIAPAEVAGMIDAFEAGDYRKAKEIHYRLWSLNRAMFLETNPIPVKTALALMNRVSPELRLPLSPMSDANMNKLKQVLKDHKMI